MVERFIAPVLKTIKVPGEELLTQDWTRTDASGKVPKRTCICQYAVNTNSTEITQSRLAPRFVEDSSVTLAVDSSGQAGTHLRR
jgi:hypothetical protein